MTDPIFSNADVQRFLDTPRAAAAPAPEPRRAQDAQGNVYVEGPDGQWRDMRGQAYQPPVAVAPAASGPAQPATGPASAGGSWFDRVDNWSKEVAKREASMSTLDSLKADAMVPVVAGRNILAGLVKLPWNIGEAALRGTDALGLGGHDAANWMAQEAAGVDKVLPPISTGSPVRDVTSSVMQYGLPAIGAAGVANDVMAGLPWWERLIGGAAAAGATDAAVTDPGQKGSLTLGDMLGVGPTQTAGKPDMAARGAVALEGGTIAALLDAAVRGGSAGMRFLRGDTPPPASTAGPTPSPPVTPPSGGQPGGAPPRLSPPSAPGAGPQGAADGAARPRQAQPGQAQPAAGPAIENHRDPVPTTQEGFVADPASGQPVKFGTQKQAGNWILNVGNRADGRQIWEIANHPTGGFTVRATGLADEPPVQAAAAPRRQAPAGEAPPPPAEDRSAPQPAAPQRPAAPAPVDLGSPEANAAQAEIEAEIVQEKLQRLQAAQAAQPGAPLRIDVHPTPRQGGAPPQGLPRPTEAPAAAEPPRQADIQADIPAAHERQALSVAADLGVPTHDIISPENGPPVAPGESATAATVNATGAEPGQIVARAPTTFTTAKGSTYEVHADGTTTRNKSFHPEHGAADQGPQPRSGRTIYVTPEAADALSVFQTQGDGKALAINDSTGHAAVLLTSGPNAGKLLRTSHVPFQREPAVGLIPVEAWKGGTRVHFGNQITGVSGAAASPHLAAEQHALSVAAELGAPTHDLTAPQEGAPHVAGQESPSAGRPAAPGGAEARPPAGQEAGGPPGGAQHGADRPPAGRPAAGRPVPAGEPRAAGEARPASAKPGAAAEPALGERPAAGPADRAAQPGGGGQDGGGPPPGGDGPGHAAGPEGEPSRPGGSMGGADQGAGGAADRGNTEPGRKPAGSDSASNPGVTLGANPFLNVQFLRHVAPELIVGTVTGMYDDYYNYGRIGVSARGFLAGFLAMAAGMHLKVGGKAPLGPGGHAATGLERLGEAAGTVPGLKHFHPRNGVAPDLWARVQAMRVATRNWQVDAITIAKEMQANFTQAERALMSDWIEKVDFPDAQGNVRPGGFRAAAQHVKDAADALAAHAEHIGQQLVNLGMLDKESFDRLKGQYLHRYYDQHIDATTGSGYRAQRESVAGSWGKRRGEGKEIATPGAKPAKGDTITQMTNPKTGDVRYATAGEVAGLQGKGYVTGKLWQVDAVRGGKTLLWRDFTPFERRTMGEIRDASYRFARGTAEASRDLALGHLFSDIAGDARWASQTAQPGWVQVTKDNVAGTSIKKYGKLAGMWVDPQVMDAIAVIRKPWTNTASETINRVVRGYLKAMTLWKVGKTAYNPASHLNNIVSNIGMALISDAAGPLDILRAAKLLKAGDPVIEEARRAGLTIGTSVNIGEELKGFERELGLLGPDPRGRWARIAQFFIDNPVTRTYGGEDSVFKVAAYLKAKAAGATPAEAVAKAHENFFDYGQAPLGVQAMRDIPLPIVSSPFFTWNYFAGTRMVKLLAEAPHRVAAALGIMSAMGIASYGYLYPQNPLGRDQWESSTLPKYLQGGGPMEMRLPWNTKDQKTGLDEANFINLRYLMPGGTMLDYTSNSQMGPQLWPGIISGSAFGGNPLSNLIMGMLMDRDTFYDKPISEYPNASYFDPETPAWQKEKNIAAFARWAAYQILPPIVMLPDKLGNAAVGDGAIAKDGGLANFMGWTGMDYSGRQQSLVTALERAVGVKVDKINPQQQENYAAFADTREINDARDALLKASLDRRTPERVVKDHIQALIDAASKAKDHAQQRETLRKGAEQ